MAGGEQPSNSKMLDWVRDWLISRTQREVVGGIGGVGGTCVGFVPTQLPVN